MSNYKLMKYGANEKELDSLNDLQKRYNKIIKPGIVDQLTNKVGSMIPEKVKNLKDEFGNKISESELYIKMIKIADEGFGEIESRAAKYTLTDKQIVKRINKNLNININSMEDICWLNSYDLEKIVNEFKVQDISVAGIEGAATGAIGFAGIPFNLVLSTFLYFRGVQAIAMFYGYDVKNNPDELAITGEVLRKALNPKNDNDENDNDNVNVNVSPIEKILLVSKAEAIKQISKKSWTEMASQGGIPLLLTQIRALGNEAANKALQNAGKDGLENSVFKDVLTQIGKRLPKKAISGIAIGASALFSSLIDGNQMKNVLEYADIFYQKRFILEKENRIKQTAKYKKIKFASIGGIILFVILLIMIICILVIK